jgi:hypothetical protein
MPKLVTALMVRNEADKYLERVLRRCLEFSDEVILVDDSSTDGSDRMAWRLGCSVVRRSKAGMWGNEAPARAELWGLAAKAAGDGWVLICDADMVLYGDPRPLTLTTQFNSWAWVLYDMWSTDGHYRCDGFWQGHLHPRPWMFKPSALLDPPIWPTRGIHCGHAPENFPLHTGILDNSEYYWIHLPYSTPQSRQRKHAQYMEQAHQLTGFERAHADSILD